MTAATRDAGRLMALSIRLPWTWAILACGKRIENRGWSTTYRGPILIHASSWWNAEEIRAAAYEIMAIREATKWPKPEPTSMAKLREHAGGFVGRARIVDCVPWPKRTAPNPWHAPGRWGIVLADVEAIPFVPWKGALGLFSVPADALQPRES